MLIPHQETIDDDPAVFQVLPTLERNRPILACFIIRSEGHRKGGGPDFHGTKLMPAMHADVCISR